MSCCSTHPPSLDREWLSTMYMIVLIHVFLFSQPQSSQLTNGGWYVSVESEPALGLAAGDISVVQDGVQALQDLPCRGVCV